MTEWDWSRRESLTATPKENLTVSQWAEKYRVLKAQAEIKGPLRMARTPYLVPILNLANRIDPSPECNPKKVSFDHVQDVVICKPAQWAGTEGVISLAGYLTHQEGKSVLVSLADEDTMRYMALNRIQTMFTDSPVLDDFRVAGHWNVDEMALANGGKIFAAWASSVSKAASKPIDVIIADEIDKPGYYAKSKEASALSLLAERKAARTGGQFWKLSTPSVEGGNMDTELNNCDIIYDAHVPCHACGVYQPLRWSERYAPEFEKGIYRDKDGADRKIGGVVWDGGHEASRREILAARYRCGACSAEWTNQQKENAVSRFVMVPRKEITETPVSVGFHSNRIYSLLGTAGRLSTLVSDWCKIHNITDKTQRIKAKQGFINSTLATFWKQTVIKSNISNIMNARCDTEPSVVPPEAIALTAGIDMQKYGFYYIIRAWARDYTSWLIQYGQVATWGDLESLLFETAFPVTGSGNQLRIWRACLDTGGGKSGSENWSMTEEAYFWIRKNGAGRGCRVYGTKGSSHPLAGRIQVGKPLDKTPSGKPMPGGLQLVMLDTGKLKEMYHHRIAQAVEGGTQAAYLHSKTGEDYARHILAEEKRINAKGMEEWVQVSRDNHWFDAETLSMICAEPEWPGGGVHLIAPPRKPTTRQPHQPKKERVQIW